MCMQPGEKLVPLPGSAPKGRSVTQGSACCMEVAQPNLDKVPLRQVSKDRTTEEGVAGQSLLEDIQPFQVDCPLFLQENRNWRGFPLPAKPGIILTFKRADLDSFCSLLCLQGALPLVRW